MNIKILGTGCMRCRKLAEMAREVINENRIPAEIEKVENFDEIRKYKIFMTPALVIDEKVIFSGKVPSKNELSKIIAEYQN